MVLDFSSNQIIAIRSIARNNLISETQSVYAIWFLSFSMMKNSCRTERMISYNLRHFVHGFTFVNGPL